MQSISRIFKNKCDRLAQSYHINDSTCNYIKFLVVCHVLKIANIVKLVERNEMAKRWTKKRCTNVRFNPFQWRQYSHQMNPVCSYPNVALSIGCKRLYLLYSSIECVCVQSAVFRRLMLFSLSLQHLDFYQFDRISWNVGRFAIFILSNGDIKQSTSVRKKSYLILWQIPFAQNVNWIEMDRPTNECQRSHKRQKTLSEQI